MSVTMTTKKPRKPKAPTLVPDELIDPLLAPVEGKRDVWEDVNRNSLNRASGKDRKTLAAALKPIYQAPSADIAAMELDVFAEGDWGKKFPTLAAMWRRQWEQVIPFFVYPLEVWKIIYTTNAIVSMHMQLRKIVKNRGHFPSDKATCKLLYLPLRTIAKNWKMPQITWKQAAIVRQAIHEYAEPR